MLPETSGGGYPGRRRVSGSTPCLPARSVRGGYPKAQGALTLSTPKPDWVGLRWQIHSSNLVLGILVASGCWESPWAVACRGDIR